MKDQPEQRQGNTGVWTFVLMTDDNKVLATSEWGTNYEFNEKEWHALSVLIPIEPAWFPPGR